MIKTLVKVEWNDAQDFSEAWVDAKSAEEFGEVECRIVSVGYQISSTAKYVTIAGDYHADEDDYGRVTKIPRGMIISITNIAPSPDSTEPQNS